MNTKVNIDLATIKFLFNKYRSVLVPLGVIAVCFVLLIYFVIPQFKDVVGLVNQAQIDSKKNEILKKNIELLSKIDPSTLDSYLKIVNFALPLNKDFIGIINAIAYSSSVSGGSISEFNLEIGDLSDTADVNTGKYSAINVSLFVDGDINIVNQFVDVLSKTFPLSSVTGINVGNTSSVVQVSFYYKPLAPSEHDDSKVINPISSDSLTLLDNLSDFNYNFSDSFNSLPQNVSEPVL